MKICLVGLGYIGLPTAVLFARSGCTVQGVDSQPSVVDRIGRQIVDPQEPGLREALADVLASGALTVSTELVAADVYLVCVQTPMSDSRVPDLSFVEAAAVSLLPWLRSGNLVLLESTVPPGTMERVLLPILGRTGLRLGEELHAAYSPERVLPGRVLQELAVNSRIIGGIDDRSTRMAVALYRHFVRGDIHTTDLRTAEMIKLIENTYRDVNIAYVNELARLAETIGFNVWEAVRLANTHPRVHVHQPGPGVGGHCIAVDPWFIVDAAAGDAPLVKLARDVNDAVPLRVAAKVETMVAGVAEPVVTLLGLAFKGDVADTRNSPSAAVRDVLAAKGYRLRLFDPYVRPSGDGWDAACNLEAAAAGSDCLVLLTDHSLFREPDYLLPAIGGMRTRQVLDTRNVLDGGRLAALGAVYVRLGDGKKPAEHE
ncbi:nucleotide sugar dehydrogenase [Paenibacillus koleovorans]|uniref:nucleotide sugar dehydrogenase n=1 Tax=Paenibacillus koleovorans TaxID=121608 RepID=UPI000FDB3E95|nr:nucleotide sugar dehydrogenase [Paenibacillus koleovorans]